MILYNLTTPAASYPVSLTEAKASCEVGFTDDDTYLNDLIAAATGVIEEMSGKQLVTQTWTRTSPSAVDKVQIEKRPLISVTSMSYYDRDDSLQTLDVANFYIYKSEDRAWIEPKENFDWPDLYDRMDALSIVFTTGYATIPPELKQAIRMLIRYWYDSRATATEKAHLEVPYGVKTLVGLRRVGWVA